MRAGQILTRHTPPTPEIFRPSTEKIRGAGQQQLTKISQRPSGGTFRQGSPVVDVLDLSDEVLSQFAKDPLKGLD